MKSLIRKGLKSILSKLEQPTHSDRQYIRTDQGGHSYYIKDIAKYHGSRRVALQAILDQMARGIDNTNLVDLLGKCSQKIMAGDRQGAIYAIANIKARTADITNHSLLYRAALICVLAEDEPDEYSSDWSRIKERRWAKDEDSRFFFMHWSLSNLQGLKSISQEQLRTLIATLDENQKIKSQLLN